MSKSKKQKPEDEPVKLDMPFEDAIRLAMKTSPAMRIKLVPEEETEIKGSSGRVIELRSIEVVNNKTGDDLLPPKASDFYLEAVIKKGNKVSDPMQFILPPDPKQVYLHRVEFYRPNNNYPAILVADDATLFLTLQPLVGRKHNVKSGILDYVNHLKSKV